MPVIWFINFNTVLFLSVVIPNLVADCSYELFSISSTRDTKIIDFIEQLSDQCEFSIIITDPNAQKFLERKLNKTHIFVTNKAIVSNYLFHKHELR